MYVFEKDEEDEIDVTDETGFIYPYAHLVETPNQLPMTSVPLDWMLRHPGMRVAIPDDTVDFQ